MLLLIEFTKWPICCIFKWKYRRAAPVVFLKNRCSTYRWYMYGVHESCLLFKISTRCPCTSENFPPLDLGRLIFYDPSPLPLSSPTNYGITTAPCMWTNEIKTKPKLTWLHCLPPESMGRFLANNTLMCEWYLVIP